MSRLRVDYTVDERVFSAELERAVARNQGMFADDVRPLLREAAAGVIYGNFTGQGRGSRPVGSFKDAQSRRYRGWVEAKHGSDRNRMSQRSQPSADFQRLRNSFLLDAARRVQPHNPALQRIRNEAQSALLMKADPHKARPGEGYDNLRGFLLNHRLGAQLTRTARRKASRRLGSNARWGVQTGRLARAWYDLGVSVKPSGTGLHAEFKPSSNHRTPGTPDAERLTAALASQAGPRWNGLMDHEQLVQALQQAGVVVRG